MTSSIPLQWIRLELIPLVSHETEFSEMLLWWNPDAGVLQGESVEVVLQLIQEALKSGCCKALCSIILKLPILCTSRPSWRRFSRNISG